MRVVVRLPSALRAHGDGSATVVVDVAGHAGTVAAVLDAVESRFPGVGQRIRDERGVVRRHVNLFVGHGEDFERAEPQSIVPAKAELVVLPSVSGGEV